MFILTRKKGKRKIMSTRKTRWALFYAYHGKMKPPNICCYCDYHKTSELLEGVGYLTLTNNLPQICSNLS